jgi:hypothetical protein
MAFAAVGAATLAYTAYSGERANSAQTRARRRQQVAQDEALRVQSLERSRQVQAEQAAATRKPPASTMAPVDDILTSDLTGGRAQRPRLGRRTTLGGGA